MAMSFKSLVRERRGKLYPFLPFHPLLFKWIFLPPQERGPSLTMQNLFTSLLWVPEAVVPVGT
ncbi:hypothetical protein NM74_07810 [Aeromonas hydrophila]|nr:hypothetical protein NM74_07810 [Aeromonas hydrophila]